MIFDYTVEFVIFVAFYAGIISILPLILVCKIFKKCLQLYLMAKHSQEIKFLAATDVSFIMAANSLQPVMDVTFLVKGNLDTQYIRSLVENKWTSAKKCGEQTYKHPKVRSTVAKSFGYFYWLQDKNFNIDNHIQLHDCTPPKDNRELLKVISEICSKELPDNKPLWELLLFPLDKSYHNESSYAILMRTHHVIADGYSFTRLFIDCFFDPKTVKVIPRRKQLLISGSKIINYVTSIYKFPKYFISLWYLPNKNAVHGDDQSGTTLVGLARPVAIDRVKRIGRSTGTSVNDIFVSCVNAAMIKFFQTQKVPPEGCTYFTPMTLNYGDTEEPTFSNRVSVINMSLQLSHEGPVELLEATRQELMTKYWKLQYGVAYRIMSRLFLNQLPSAVTGFTNKVFDVTYYVTNVPGPLNECLMTNGDRVVKLLPIAVLLLKTGIAFGVSCCNEEVQLAVKIDLGVVKDAEFANRITGYFNEEFEKLEAATKNA